MVVDGGWWLGFRFSKGRWLGFSNGGWWIGISNGGGGGGGGGWWFCDGLFLFGRRENTKRERKRCIRLKNIKEVVKIDKVIKKLNFLPWGVSRAVFAHSHVSPAGSVTLLSPDLF